MANTLDFLERHMYSREWEISPMKIQAYETSVKLLGIQSSWNDGTVSQSKGKYLHFPLPFTKIEA